MKAQQLEPKLYDGNAIKNTCAIVILDFEETLMHAEESRSKMILKQDPMVLEKKNFMNSLDPNLSRRPTKVEVPKELPKASMEQAAILREVVEQEKSQNPLNNSLGYALGHNLFSVGQFYDSNFEVAFRQHTCYIRNLEGVDLLTRSRGNNIYTLSLGDMMASSPNVSCQRPQRLSHGYGPSVFCLCNGQKQEKPHKPKFEDTNQEKLYLLHMDLCGLMHVASVNRKKYIIVMIDDYSWFTWVKCLRSKDETPDFIIKFLKMIQVQLKTLVRQIRTDNGTEFVNQSLREYYETVDISHKTSGPTLQEMTHATTSSGLVPNPPSSTSVDPSAPEVITLIAEIVAPEPVVSTSSPSSTTVDQDASSPKNDSKASSSSNVIPIVMHSAAPNLEHVTKWTKDHPLDNIIDDLERPVSIRLQLYEEALFCYYDAFLTSIEPKNYKDVLTQACWIESMQEELHEFKRLEVWELIPHLGLWILQSPKGIFINQSKYALESLKKYGMESSDPVDTPMVEKSKLDEDPQGKAVDPTHYRGMVGTLMYLTASRPDLTFVCSDQEKKIQKIDHLERSLLIQGLANDIYSLIDSNKTAKDLLDALARHMLGYEYALIAEKTKVSKRKEKVVSLNSEGSDADDFSELKKITAFGSDQEINANMVFMDQIEKVLSDSEASPSSVDDKISEVSYYLSESESESEYETSEYYDNTTTYGLLVNDNDDQEIFHDCQNFLENLIESQIDHNESVVDHNDSEGMICV
nr:integrase, catalytic region, zinc finger, CCHC-type, peptidase aspartic, catalytic [Tanacetum cinerariifolium]